MYVYCASLLVLCVHVCVCVCVCVCAFVCVCRWVSVQEGHYIYSYREVLRNKVCVTKRDSQNIDTKYNYVAVFSFSFFSRNGIHV